MKLDGRLCLVTGAGSGIGRALAQRLAAEGARLVLAGRTAATLGETAALLGAGARPHVVVADIGDAAGRQRLCDEVRGLGGRLDLLVHNAGIQFAGPVDRIDDAALEAMIRAANRAVLPTARENAYARCLARLNANPPWLYLFHPVDVFAAKPACRGLTLDPKGVLGIPA